MTSLPDPVSSSYRRPRHQIPTQIATAPELLGSDVAISEVFHDAGGVYDGTDEPYLFGRIRVSGPDPEHHSYRSFASFSDPDGNGWLLQEVSVRLPGRVDADDTTFTSSTELATAAMMLMTPRARI